ncbi:MAG: alpha/beta hydrolase-fold protein [Streptosporangiaceae bacterium]
MRREWHQISSPAGISGAVISYGHWGRPLLAFPAESGSASDFENNGIVAAVASLIDAGRVKLYCADAFDAQTWARQDLPLEERARRHGSYESWIVDGVAPFIRDDCGGATEIMTTGCSLGAYHAVNFALKRADLFPLAIGLSGNYDPSAWRAWGERGDAAYFNNPFDYVANADGGHLEWLRSRVSILLVVGQGAWETHPTGALPSSRQLAALLQDKGIRCELDLWGYDVAHDWPWWGRELAHHLPRFC